MKTLDTAFLGAPADRHVSLAVGAVAIVDGAIPDCAMLQCLLAERIQSLLRFTQLLRAHPSGPEWSDYPQFDLANHVRRVAIPRPGDDAGLSAAIAFALERPLDPHRPPWECWVIEGLQGSRWAILMKVGQCLADVTSPAHLLIRLCDDADTGTFTNPDEARQVSATQPQPKKQGWADALWRASSVAGTVTNALASAIWPAPQTSPINAATMRRYRTVRVPITDVDRVCRKFGVTANDVALAAITEGFRTVLLQRGEQPRADSLPTLVPTPIHSAALPYLPVEHDDPVRRLRTVHHRRKAGQVQPTGGIMESALNCLPTGLRDNCLQVLQALQLMDRLPQHDIVTLATAVPGPRRQLRLMGQTIQRLLPIPPTAMRLSTGVAVLSYGDELVFGITTEYHAVCDVKRLAAGIELGMARLVALSQDSVLLFTKDHRRKRPSRAVTAGTPRVRLSAPEQARHRPDRRYIAHREKVGHAKVGAGRHRPTPP